MGAYFGVIRRELAAKGFSQAFINNLETILTTANSASDTADTATTDLATLQADVTALQTEVDAIEPDAALLAPLASGELPGGAVGQVQYNSNGVFGGFTVSGDGTLDTSTGAFTLATVPVIKGGTGATTAAGARTNLGAAASGANSDITSLSALSTPLSVAQGGTGQTALASVLGVGSALKWTTARTLSFTGDATGSSSVDGSASVATALTLASTAVTPGSYTSADITVDAKGRITAAASGASSSGTVTHTGGALTLNQLVFGNGTADIKVGDLTGDVTTSGGTATTIGALKVATGMIQASAVTLAKIANAASNSKVLGSGSSGAGAAYAELALTAGSGISITPDASGFTFAATGASVPSTSLSPPQGRLTLVTGVPVMTSDQTAKTHVYYTPYIGAVVPVYSGSAWALTTLSADLDMALDTSNQLLENVYDLFIWNAGASIGCGPAWVNSATITVTIATPAVVSWTAHGLSEGAPVIFTNSGGALPTGITAGTTYYVTNTPSTNSFNISTSVANAAAGTKVATSGSQSGTHTGTNHTTLRGTGAGTTELQMLNGIWTNKNAITLTNGAGAGTSGIAANTATFVGSIYCTANGQTGMAYQPTGASGGSANVLGVGNAYNPKPVSARELDSTASWSVSSSSWAAANAGGTGNGSLNRISYLDCLGQTTVRGQFTILSVNGTPNIGMSRDSSTADPKSGSQWGVVGNGSDMVFDSWLPSLGVHYIQAQQVAAAGTPTLIANETGPTRTHYRLQVDLEM